MDEKEAEARPVMGTIFLVYWASEASPTLGCSIEISRDIYIYIYICIIYVCCRYGVCLSYVKLTA